MINENEVMANLAVSLGQLVIKGTATIIHQKTRALKEEKDIQRLRATYDELLSEVISERDEAVQIAQAYKSELDKIKISDDDIQHLHNTVENVLQIINSMQSTDSSTGSKKINSSDVDKFVALISVDTLKTMQLIGFNYKAAIGEPLTKLCAEKINAWNANNASNKKR
ncbi:MAG: hypothetical protein LKF83_06930 [Solobacterium sp.]|jgi:ElaB/YqjD/DUF883 family membrane-anchored ribosome-binding protein|nr:hypothetical protein [Solobacterium sp.]